MRSSRDSTRGKRIWSEFVLVTAETVDIAPKTVGIYCDRKVVALKGLVDAATDELPRVIQNETGARREEGDESSLSTPQERKRNSRYQVGSTVNKKARDDGGGNLDKEPEELVEDLAQEHKTANRKQESSNRTVSTQPQQPPRLQDYCPTGVYVSMVITYPAEVDKFQVIRPDPEPELECLERVSINIVDNNFPQIFPERHVKFLDRLKQHKRSATEEQTANPSIKSKENKHKKEKEKGQCWSEKE
ncbi:hypothetical protein F5H01DRAFT_319649 [Linnemannia elongata]|nr:hypothetical protein F5H01DRAFT_319649 [Linnemannia elongata]